jgi:hypothetical protein
MKGECSANAVALSSPRLALQHLDFAYTNMNTLGYYLFPRRGTVIYHSGAISGQLCKTEVVRIAHHRGDVS